MIDGILQKSVLQKARVGVEVRSLDTGETIYTHNADELLNPASNVKLITAATALAKLGPEFRFATDFSCSEPISHGECHTLYIRGRGDPTLYTERIFGIAGELQHRGLKRIGDIVVDDSYFDAEREGPGWEQEHGGDRPYMAPTGALSVNHNTVAIYVSPGDVEKSRARIELEPSSDYFIVENKVHTADRKGRARLLPRSFGESGHQRIVVSGRLPLGRDTAVFYKKVDNPPVYAGETFKAIFRARGIAAHGKVRQGSVPDDAVRIYVDRSEELGSIVREMNKVSSNFVAEQLIKTIGAEVKGTPGTWGKGIASAEEYLASIGIQKGAYVMKNGSGLNDTNRFSAGQLAALLTWVATKTDFYPELAASLGIAGRDGTVRSRMDGTVAEGRLRAKTGTLESVTALSGYVRCADNETLVYSILTNDISPRRHSPYIAAMDSLAVAIATGGEPDSQSGSGTAVAANGDLRARITTFSNLGRMADPSNLPFLHSALTTEQDPVMRAVIADAIFKSDKDNGTTTLLDAVPADPAAFARLRTIAHELAVPTPMVSSLIDVAADGNPDALDKLLVIAHESKGDPSLETVLAEGLEEIGRTAPEELFEAVVRAPADVSPDTVALLGKGIGATEEKAMHPFLEQLKAETDQKVAAAALQMSDRIKQILSEQKPAPGQGDVKPAVAPIMTLPHPPALPGGG
jgi:D-alanyl-D-alanine carboxypeptidase/D-alanyl-D-alanine-endopeptidase (penicillin-binding protein 4)